MSRTTGNADIDARIFEKLRSPNSKAIVTFDRWDGSAWVNEPNYDAGAGASWTDSVKRTNFANYGLQPISNKISYNIINRDGEYSPGSGEPEDNVYDLETRVRINVSYPLERKDLVDENGDILTDENGNALTVQDTYLLYRSVYYCDAPSYNVNNTQIDTVSISARDAYKFAIEKDVFLDDLSAGIAIDALIKNICDQIGISYSSTSIADLSSFGDRTLADGLNEPQKADKIFSIIMAIINQNGSPGYQMYLQYDDAFNDNILYVEQIPNLFEADFSFGTAEIIGVSNFQKDKNRFLQRLTITDQQQTPNERELLGTATYTTDGEKTLALSGDSLYRSYEVTVNSGTPVVTLVQVNNASIVFNVTNTGSVTVDVYGTRFDTYPTITGEAINNSNMQNKVGQTAQIQSLLFESDAEARLTAEGLVSKFGNPDKQANGLEYPYLNIMLENNDMTFPFIRNIFETDLYFIVSIKHRHSTARESTTFDIQDSGLNWEDIYAGFIYDSDFIAWPNEGEVQDKPTQALPLKYDIGLRYDMTYGPNIDVDAIPDSRTYDVEFS